MTKDEALKKAFKQAFQLGQDYWYQADHEYVSQNKKSDVTRAKFEQLMEDAIKEALAQPEQEPVAYQDTADKCRLETVLAKGGLLPQRTWVGLKDDDEIDWDGGDLKSFVRAIEAKLKEKNT